MHDVDERLDRNAIRDQPAKRVSDAQTNRIGETVALLPGMRARSRAHQQCSAIAVGANDGRRGGRGSDRIGGRSGVLPNPVVGANQA